MYSELEVMIMDDMIHHGYNPHNPSDVILYWEERL